MPRRVKAVSHEDRLSLVEHLDELRWRIIVCIAVLGVALALCFWQNHLLLEIAAGPLPAHHKQLITFSVTEPFTTTVTVAAYGAIVLSLPIILWQLYAYVLPAFSPHEKTGRAADPAALPDPLPRRPRLLLLGGDAGRGQVPARLQRKPVQHPGPRPRLLQLLRDDDAGRRPRLPAAAVVLAITRLGIVKVEQLSSNRRYAYLLIAIVAAALPGVDPVSMIIEMVPLLVLFELSILLAKVLGRAGESTGVATPSPQE